jgi:hypothetical protein
MTWTIRYKTYAGDESESNYDFANEKTAEEMAIKQAHEMQRHPHPWRLY